MKPLKEVCAFIGDGNWIESKDQSPEGIRLIQTGNIGTGYFRGKEEKSKYISEPTFNRLKCTEVYEGDCLVSRLPDPVGRACVLPSTQERMITAVDCAILRFKKNVLIPEFFVYFSQSHDYLESVISEATGTTRTRISRKNLSAITVPVPPLPEQRRIVAILDEAFEGIATAKGNAEKNLQNAREVFESNLNAVFSQRGEGWVEKRLGNVAGFIDYRGRTPTKTECGLRLITAKNVKMGFIKLTPMEFVSPNSYDSWMTRGIPKYGDVLFTTEAPLANIAQLDTEDKVVFAQRIIILQADHKEIISAFLKYELMSPPVQQRIHSMGTGATVKGIKARLLKQIEIHIPSLTEQRRIVAILDKLSQESQRLESIYQQKLAALDELKQSLLHQAFNGDL